MRAVKRILKVRLSADLAIYSLVTLFILGPLLMPGYILTLDMVFAPQLRMPDTVSSSYVFLTLLHVLDLALPADLVQKLLLAVIFLLAGCGMHRLARHAAERFNLKLADNMPLYFAGFLYMVNPYTYDRLITGQYNVLFGYALLPWFALAVFRLAGKPNWRAALVAAAWAIAISIVSIHSVGFAAIIAGLIIFRHLWGMRRQRQEQWRLIKFTGAVAALAVVASLYWLLPAVAGAGSQAQTIQSITSSDRLAFATTGANPLERLGNVIGLQGFWAERYGLFVLPQDVIAGWLWLLAMLVLFALVVVGAVSTWRRNRGDSLIFISCIVIAALLAAGIGGSWLAAHVPFFRGYREPQKFVGLIALAYGVLGSVGFAAVRQRLQARLSSSQYQQLAIGLVVGILLVLPAMIAPSIWWGANRQLQAAQYPASWYAVNRQLNADSSNFQTLFLPWHLYMYLDFPGRTVANPAPAFFDKPVIVSNDAELEGVALSRSTPVTRQVDALLKRMPDEPNTETFGRQLAAAGVKYVILAKDSDYRRYDYLAKQTNLKRIADYPEISLYRIER